MFTALSLVVCATSLAVLVTLDFARRLRAARPELEAYLGVGSDDA